MDNLNYDIHSPHYWSKLATMQHVRVSLITKKLYSM